MEVNIFDSIEHYQIKFLNRETMLYCSCSERILITLFYGILMEQKWLGNFVNFDFYYAMRNYTLSLTTARLVSYNQEFRVSTIENKFVI